MAKGAIADGSALNKLKEMVYAQGGNPEWIDDTSLFPKAEHSLEIKAEADGYIKHMDAEKIGIASLLLGAGRNTKYDELDFSAGIILKAKTGDFVSEGEVIATLYSEKNSFEASAKKLLQSTQISATPPEKRDLVLARVE
jgi:pyrimidine-nucleoside phosphorylase